MSLARSYDLCNELQEREGTRGEEVYDKDAFPRAMRNEFMIGSGPFKGVDDRPWFEPTPASQNIPVNTAGQLDGYPSSAHSLLHMPPRITMREVSPGRGGCL
jgi:hypothetical protein